MARVKTNRTERITLMLSPDEIKYLMDLAAKREMVSISAVAQQVIKEHQVSFFDRVSTRVEETTEVEAAA